MHIIIYTIIFMECIYITKVLSHFCNFTPVSQDEFHTDSELYHHHSNSRQKRFANFTRSEEKVYAGPIRIHFEYTRTFEDYPNSREIIEKIFNVVKKEFHSFLHVKRSLIDQNIIVPKQCNNGKYVIIDGKKICKEDCRKYTICAGSIVPDKYLKKCLKLKKNNSYASTEKDGKGEPNVDFILIVDKKICEYNLTIRARSCFHDKYDRPILGATVICEEKIVIEENMSPYITYLKHEIIHALGFDATKFAYFHDFNGHPIVKRDKNGVPINWDKKGGYYQWNNMIAQHRSRVHHSVGESYELDFQSFVMPKTVDIAKKHFNCLNLDGVDFENIDPLPSKANHFDELIYGTEIMTPMSQGDFDVLSSLTLAFLDDTGWYNVDYRYRESYDYAKGAGCHFTSNGCYNFMKQHEKGSIEPFCNVPFLYGNIYRCKGRDYYQFCNLTKRNYMMHQYIYFQELKNVPNVDVPLYYGAYEESEYCPRHNIVEDLGYQTSVCYDSVNMRKDAIKEAVFPSYFGMDSECFENVIPDAPRNKYYGAACHKIKPINSSHFYIYFMDVEYTCIYGMWIKVELESVNLSINCGTRIVGSRIPRSLSNCLNYSQGIFPVAIILILVLHFKN